MNFGKHGRTVLLGALLASTSTLVFGGVLGGIAIADPGTIKSGNYPPSDNGGNGNDPHVDTACVGVRMIGFEPGVETTATFSTQSPTKDLSSLTVSGDAASVVAFDLKPWLASLETSKKQGVHITVDVNGKKKTFWIADPSQGCTDSIPVTPPAPVVKCANRSGYFGDSLTSDYAVLNPGSGIGILYQGKVAIDLSMVEYSIDGVATSNIALDPHADGTVGIWAFTDPGIADGAHTATVKINLGDGSCASKSWNFTTLGSGGAT